MRDLDDYLQGDFQSVGREIADIERHLVRLARTYADAPWDDRRRTCWSYEIRPWQISDPCGDRPQAEQEADQRPGGFSITTTAAILAALDALFGEAPRLRASSGYRQQGEFSPPRLDLEPEAADRLTRRRETARAELAHRLMRPGETAAAFFERLDLPDPGPAGPGGSCSVSARPMTVSWSGTFGADDPLTAGWLLDVVCPGAGDGGAVAGRLTAMVQDRLLAWSHSRRIGECFDPPRATAGESSYLLIRLARFLSALEGRAPVAPGVTTAGPRDRLLAHFEARLHEQLSLAEIPFSRFDPSELAYALEGLLLLGRHAVDEQVFDRVFGVMARAQEVDVSWRAQTPILFEAAGKVLFPVSVETASALLAALILFDGRADGQERFHDARGGRHIAMLMRYWTWLRARMVVARAGRRELIGWHSEHVNDPGLIHAWETAQVLEFLLALRHQAKRVLAREALILSRLSRKAPAERSRSAGPAAFWAGLAARVEPVGCLGPGLEIYRRIGEDFIAGHRQDGAPEGQTWGAPEAVEPPDRASPPAWSMLLYGPPGTGKTTVAEMLAAALGWPLITVTVGDFLAAGSALIEARAKNLFEVLKVQPRSVVLFDEIDQFLLDRDSQHFREQDTVFQFLTPGMLTKLNDLRQAEAVIFILATNYAERIDAAIKRSGRIDRQYLLLPLDGTRRLSLLGVAEASGAAVGGTGPAADAALLRRLSVFLGFADLRRLAARPRDGAGLAGRLHELSPAVHPATYGARFVTRDQQALPADKVPIEEFLALLLLDYQARDPAGLARGEGAPEVIAGMRVGYREVLAAVGGGPAARPETVSAILRRWGRPELFALIMALLNG